MPALVTRVAIASLTIGCASSPATESRDRVIARTDDVVVRSADNYPKQIVHLAVSAEGALTALAAVYREIGVEVKVSDPLKGVVGNRNFSVYHRLGGVALDRYIGCGTTPSGPGANSYRVTMSLLSYVRAEPGGNSIQTRLSAAADDPSSSKGRLSCLSTGALEQRINDMVSSIVGH